MCSTCDARSGADARSASDAREDETRHVSVFDSVFTEAFVLGVAEVVVAGVATSDGESLPRPRWGNVSGHVA